LAKYETMDNINTYDESAAVYDKWFDQHSDWFRSEVAALKKALPEKGRGIVVGMGSGRFAQALGIHEGIESTEGLASLARQRSLMVTKGVVEELPYQSESLDYLLMVTIDCYLKDLARAFMEIRRVLRPGGRLIIGMIDKSGDLGKKYEARKKESVYYSQATFHDVEEMTSELKKADFHDFQYWQTLSNIAVETFEEPQPGHGNGSFAVISALK